MVKRNKLVNTGDETEVDPMTEIDTEFSADASGEAAVTQEGNGDSDQDLADQEAAGVTPAPRTAPVPGLRSGENQSGHNQGPTLSPKMQYNALKRKVTALGAEFGSSKTSMINLAETVTEAAQDGFINDQQAGEIYDKFREGVTAKSTYEDAGVVPDEAAMDRVPTETGEKSRDQQLSKLRRFIHLGNKYETDALDLVRRARNMHIDLLRQALGSPETKRGVKPGSTYNILVDVARAQLQKQKEAVDAGRKSGVKHTGLAPVLTDEEIAACMTQEVKEAAPKTGEDKLLDAYITAKAAYKGGKERNPVPSTELQNAIDWLRQALAVTAPGLLKEHEDKLAQAEKDAAQAAADKAERERVAAEKAAQPKQSKAQRQATLATQPAA
jgi:hypothetical protein